MPVGPQCAFVAYLRAQGTRATHPHRMSGFDARRVAEAVLGNGQMIISTRLGRFLRSRIPRVQERLVVILTAIAVTAQAKPGTQAGNEHDVGDGVWGNIALTTLASTCTELLTVRGAGGSGLMLAQLVVTLVFFDGLLYCATGCFPKSTQTARDVLQSNLTYIFGTVMSTCIQREVGEVTAGVLAVGLISVSASKTTGWIQSAARREVLLVEGAGIAGVHMLQTIVLGGIPPAASLVTILTLMCFTAPIQRTARRTRAFVGFIAYSAAGEVSNAIEACMPLPQGMVVALALTAFAPIQSFREMGGMAVMNIGSDLCGWVLRDTLETDPFPTMGACMVFFLILMRAVFRR